MKSKFLILIPFIVLLAACSDRPTAKQIEAEGEKYATISAADQAALDAKQTRIASEHQEAYRQERRAYWSMIWQKGITAVVLSMYLVVFATGISAAALIWNTQKAFSHFVLLRASVLPMLPNGTRPAIIMPTQKSLLESITYDKAFRISGTRYRLVDSQTGESCWMDMDKQAHAPGLEILRQAIMLYVPAHEQGKTAMFSNKGQVARAIGESTLEPPSNPNMVLDLKAIKDSLLLEDK